MSVLRNDQIQAALVAYLKSKTAITNELVTVDGTALGADEIREDQWQGSEFDYPNIRVRLIGNSPLDDACNHSRITFSCMAFSETASSLQADRIAGIINTSLHDNSFTANNITFTCRLTNLIPAVRIDVRTWRSEALFQALASGS